MLYIFARVNCHVEGCTPPVFILFVLGLTIHIYVN